MYSAKYFNDKYWREKLSRLDAMIKLHIMASSRKDFDANIVCIQID